uniref:hypothetical protein n=1 Tax=Coprococcus catus TaxID=116085 RepID=UPI0022E1B328
PLGERTYQRKLVYKCALRDVAAPQLAYIISAIPNFCNFLSIASGFHRRQYHAFRMKEIEKC